jgi:hypothetical protein
MLAASQVRRCSPDFGDTPDRGAQDGINPSACCRAARRLRLVSGCRVGRGFNVYSAEVEQVILAHPAVQDCAVIGLPDDKWGERVTAVLQMRPGRAVTADEIRGCVKERAHRLNPQVRLRGMSSFHCRMHRRRMLRASLPKPGNRSRPGTAKTKQLRT